MTGGFDDNSFKINWLGKGLFSRIVGGILFVVGWVFSPLTWWNDGLINLPIAWLLASWVVPSNGKTFEFFFLFFYFQLFDRCCIGFYFHALPHHIHSGHGCGGFLHL